MLVRFPFKINEKINVYPVIICNNQMTEIQWDNDNLSVLNFSQSADFYRDARNTVSNCTMDVYQQQTIEKSTVYMGCPG